MQRRIELLQEFHEVTVAGTSDRRTVRIGDTPPRQATLGPATDSRCVVKLGDIEAPMTIRTRGEMIHIRAFGRTLATRIVNPVEQAGQRSGGSGNRAMAPMPGVVVDVHAAEGDTVAKGRPLMTIESMKILTVISAPRAGKIVRIHFSPGQPFQKGDVLVTLSPKEE